MAHDKRQPQVLVIKFGALGDFFRAIPIFFWIRERHKHAHITLLTTSEYADFAESLKLFDRVLSVRRKGSAGLKWLGATRKFFLGFNDVFDLQFVDRTKLYRLLTVDRDSPRWHCMSTESLLISAALFYKRTCPPLNNLRKFVVSNDGFGKHGITPPFIVMAPFCSKTAAWHKQWPLSRYLEVAQYAHKVGFQVVVLGDSDDAKNELLSEVAYINNLVGKTDLMDLVDLIPHSSLAVGNDTGIMHLAELYQIPTIVIMSGINSPNKAARGPQHVQFVKTPVSDISASDVMAAVDLLKLTNK